MSIRVRGVRDGARTLVNASGSKECAGKWKKLAIFIRPRGERMLPRVGTLLRDPLGSCLPIGAKKVSALGRHGSRPRRRADSLGHCTDTAVAHGGVYDRTMLRTGKQIRASGW
jgi:hypothetical protein